ncbi:MAG: MBL fold metallo-hydrolase [Pseudomonadota bacterium]
MGWMRWVASGVLALGLVLFGLSQAFRVQIGMSLFERGIERGLSRDLIGSLPDGLHVALCGTAGPMADPAREGPCTAVIAGARVFIVDVGGGTPRNLGVMGLPIGQIERVFLTHFHSDHIDGLGELLTLSWVGGVKKTPTPIHGPQGVDRVVDGFNAAYGLDAGYRTAHHGPAVAPPSGHGGAAVPFQINSGLDAVVLIDEADLKVTAFAVGHSPVEPAVGYRFDYKGRSATISGDTIYSDNLVAVSKDVDLLVSEALSADMVALMRDAAAARGIANLEKIFIDIPDYHVSPAGAAEMAQAAGADMLALTHIVPALPSRYLNRAFLGEARAAFDGPIVVGEDGMMFTLRADGSGIERRRLN